MSIVKWLFLSLSLVLAAGLAAPAGAHPARTDCIGVLADRTIDGNLLVPAGQQCALLNVVVNGDIRVQERATLEVIESRIAGALTGSDFERIALAGATVGGRVRLSGGSSAELSQSTAGGDARLVDQVDARVLDSQINGTLVVSGSREIALICGSTVEGDARFTDHRGGLLIGDDPFAGSPCSGNTVRGTVRVSQNRSDTVIANTTVGRDLICRANDPAPLFYGNQVMGTSRGQCGVADAGDSADTGDI